MAERKPRATKEESLKAKIESNLEAQAKLIAKVEALKLAEKALRQELADLNDVKKKLRGPLKQRQKKPQKPRRRRS